ncbi:hypothetical protein [Allopontixanthobacter sp.]|uniref:hypothetical protein n=1 Tax=Allopontixanthobacter sp. TaxID=2906452 RepID=UPI002AB9EFA2|nr:hypothetical protein [Allopontixanthobacter sp.]MDZ4308775.1 hypothetical protein [Allopontixanthobacter sp.]
MFVLAALSGGTFAGPVKIRNLSSTGALIEGAGLPATGTKVTLRRGESSASGIVVWSSNGKAGLRMDSRVDVSAWMPGGREHQNSIDHVVETIRKEAALNVITAVPEPSVSVSSNELLSLADAISKLADDLSDDDGIVVRFGTKLQALDIVAQVLRKLAAER